MSDPQIPSSLAAGQTDARIGSTNGGPLVEGITRELPSTERDILIEDDASGKFHPGFSENGHASLQDREGSQALEKTGGSSLDAAVGVGRQTREPQARSTNGTRAAAALAVTPVAAGPLPWTSAIPLSDGPPQVEGLRTEVMHAPPRLPNDPKYPPLDPERLELTGSALRKRTAQGPFGAMESQKEPGSVPAGIKLVTRTGRNDSKTPNLRKRALRPRTAAELQQAVKPAVTKPANRKSSPILPTDLAGESREPSYDAPQIEMPSASTSTSSTTAYTDGIGHSESRPIAPQVDLKGKGPASPDQGAPGFGGPTSFDAGHDSGRQMTPLPHGASSGPSTPSKIDVNAPRTTRAGGKRREPPPGPSSAGQGHRAKRITLSFSKRDSAGKEVVTGVIGTGPETPSTQIVPDPTPETGASATGPADAITLAAFPSSGKQVSLSGSPSKSINMSVVLGAKDDGQHEFCDTCKGPGRLICCDECPRSFHFHCLNPPLDVDEMPGSGGNDDSWTCRICSSSKLGKARRRGMLGGLISQVDTENPSIFSLPADLRSHYKGVATAEDGSYVNGAMFKPIRVTKGGVIEDRDPFKLKDRNNKPVLCYHCGQSALPLELPRRHSSLPAGGPLDDDIEFPTSSMLSQQHRPLAKVTPMHQGEGDAWRRIISCDFCSLHWHLDCLDPPMTSMPGLTRRWKCPNHSDLAHGPRRIPKLLSSVHTVELPIPAEKNVGHGKFYKTRVRNNGDVDIIPDVLDRLFSAEDGSGPGLRDGCTGVTSELPNGTRIRFKVPEKVIRSDFWTRLRKGSSGVQEYFSASVKAAEGRNANFVEVNEPNYWYRVPLHSHKREESADMLSAIATLAARQADLEAGAAERDVYMGPDPGAVAKDLAKAYHPILYPEVMDQPLVITEGGKQKFLEHFDLSNVRGIESDSDSDDLKQGGGKLEKTEKKPKSSSRSSSPLSDVSSLTDVSEIGRQVEQPPDPPPKSQVKSPNARRGPAGSAATNVAATAAKGAFGIPTSSMALVSIERLEQLAAVQRLMEVKGEAAMLKFLLKPNEPEDFDENHREPGSLGNGSMASLQ